MDECESDPCQNGATCNDQVNGFSCDCLEGFEGDLCQNGEETMSRSLVIIICLCSFGV